jgi:hypothetical protein
VVEIFTMMFDKDLNCGYLPVSKKRLPKIRVDGYHLQSEKLKPCRLKEVALI